MNDKTTASGGGCGGCLVVILFLLVAWALMFGVTADGRHYDLDCSCDHGVQVLDSEVTP